MRFSAVRLKYTVPQSYTPGLKILIQLCLNTTQILSKSILNFILILKLKKKTTIEIVYGKSYFYRYGRRSRSLLINI